MVQQQPFRRVDFLFMRMRRTFPLAREVPWTGVLGTPVVQTSVSPCRGPQAASSGPGTALPPLLGKARRKEDWVFGVARNVGVECPVSTGTVPGSRTQPSSLSACPAPFSSPSPKPSPALPVEGPERVGKEEARWWRQRSLTWEFRLHMGLGGCSLIGYRESSSCPPPQPENNCELSWG